MKKLLLSIGAGLLVIGAILVGMKFWFKPDLVYKRNAKKAAKDLASASKVIEDEETSKIYTFEEASEIYKVDQSLLLVNKEHTIDADFPSDIVEYKDTGVLMNSCITEHYSDLSAAVSEKTGDKLYVMSSYRSYEDQQRVYEEEGAEIAALPGTSEHQTGLALDVYVSEFAGAGFIESDAGMFVNEHCYDYGFIIRYPYGGESVTGFTYEPWHIRYVGLPHSKIIEESGCLFDNYADLFEIGKYYEYYGYEIARMPEDRIEIPNDAQDVLLSEDGLGYVFVTIKTAEK